jgi:GMP synthase (glutamine-hydrolysing)
VTRTKTLIIDNNIDRPWGLCGDFRRYLDGEVLVRRAPQGDLPRDPGSFSHIILSGSKTSVHDSSEWVKNLMDFIRRSVDQEIPTLGVCYGHQIIARTYGGDSVVRASPLPEVGWVEVRQTGKNAILAGLPKKFYSFQSHFEEVCTMPEAFVATAESDRCSVQAYFLKNKPVFGIQFHPERNAEEGQNSIDQKKKSVSKDCIFKDGKAESVFTENVARTIFKNFFGIR